MQQADAFYRAPLLTGQPVRWDGLIFGALQIGTLLAAVAQLLIDRSDGNLLCTVLVVASSTLTIQYLRVSRSFQAVPLTSLALLGLCLTTQWGALALQSASWQGLSHNLRDPVRTFAVLGLSQTVAVFAHLIFKHLHATLAVRRVIANRLLAPLGVFGIPSAQAMWMMGIVGSATAYATLTSNVSGDVQGVGDKALAGFNFFRVAPFLIPLLWQRYGATYCDIKRHGPALIVYFCATVAIGVATNARVLIFTGLLAVLVVYLLFTLHDSRPARARTVWRLVALGVVGIFAAGFASDVATAMLVGRAYRDKNHSQWDVIETTVDALSHPEKLKEVREKADSASIYSAYDEKYFDNQMFARIVETKFHDNALLFSKDASFDDAQRLREEVVDRLWATLPMPVLVWLKMPQVKYKTQYSMGDFWVNRRYGRDVGGFATGSLFADGTALFGDWFPLVYLMVCIFLFTCWEGLSRPGPSGDAQISIVALLMSVQLFQYGITAPAFDMVFTPLRGLPQNIAFYLLMFWSTGIVFRPFKATAAGDAKAAWPVAIATQEIR